MTVPAAASVATDDINSQLILELVAGLQPPEDILGRYGITSAQLRAMSTTPRFKQLWKEAREYWESDQNIRERIQTKAARLTEELLPELYATATNAELTPTAKLDASKQIIDLSGAKPNPKDATTVGGAGFSVVINLGGDDPKDRIVLGEVIESDERLTQTD